MTDFTDFVRSLVGLDVSDDTEDYGADAENVLSTETRVERLRRFQTLLRNQNARRSRAMLNFALLLTGFSEYHAV